MTFIIICILIGCIIAALAGKSKTPKAAAVTAQTAVTMDEDTEEAINAYAEYAIALSRRADALSKAARDEADPIKASKLRTDAARLTAQSASQSLKAAKLANKARR